MNTASVNARDFWVSSGHHLLDRGEGGGLAVTPDFLKAYLARPEMAPVPESCPAERQLHRDLLADPLRSVDAARLATLKDPDGRENYEVWLGFRDRLVEAPSLEGAYLSLMRSGVGRVPKLFLDQMVHLILRNMLDGETDPFRLRAAECLFRTQKVHIHEGGILLADEEVVEQRAKTGGFGSLGQLLAEAGTQPRSVDLDVLTEERAEEYWARSDAFDMVLDVAFTRPGLDALARVLERWVAHFLRVKVSIQPVQTIRDERWVWHVGLDAEATTILNAMWNGEDVAQADLGRVLSLFRLDFDDPAEMLERVAGRPVYLAMAMSPDRLLKLKPQNLLLGLPVREGLQ